MAALSGRAVPPPPSCISRKLTTTERTMPKINIIPPMVGVPCLFLCHRGPMSRIVCPKWSFLRMGSSHIPEIAVMAKASTTAMMIQILSISTSVRGVSPPSRPTWPY